MLFNVNNVYLISLILIIKLGVKMNLFKLSHNVFYQIYEKLDRTSQNNLLKAGQKFVNISIFKEKLDFFVKVSQFIFCHYDLVEPADVMKILFSDKKVIGLGENHTSCDHRFANACVIDLIWFEKFKLRVEGSNEGLSVEKENFLGQLSFIPKEIAETAEIWDLDEEPEFFHECRSLINIGKLFFSIVSEDPTFSSLLKFVKEVSQYKIFFNTFVIYLYPILQKFSKEENIEKIDEVTYLELVSFCYKWVKEKQDEQYNKVFGMLKNRNESLCSKVFADYKNEFSSIFVAGSLHVQDNLVCEFFNKKKVDHLLLLPKKNIKIDSIEEAYRKIFQTDCFVFELMMKETIEGSEEEISLDIERQDLLEMISNLSIKEILEDKHEMSQRLGLLKNILKRLNELNIDDLYMGSYNNFILMVFNLELTVRLLDLKK